MSRYSHNLHIFASFSLLSPKSIQQMVTMFFPTYTRNTIPFFALHLHRSTDDQHRYPFSITSGNPFTFTSRCHVLDRCSINFEPIRSYSESVTYSISRPLAWQQRVLWRHYYCKLRLPAYDPGLIIRPFYHVFVYIKSPLLPSFFTQQSIYPSIASF